MSLSGRKKLFFWSGFAVILLLYCLYYFYFIYGLAHEVPLRARHFVKLLFILACYGTGILGLSRITAAWMVRLWHIVYLVCVLLLLGMGFYDWFIARTPLQLRMIADSVQEFLVSPVFYVVLGLFGSYLKGL